MCSLYVQWLDDVRQKVMLENDEPVPVLLLANKVRKKERKSCCKDREY